MLAELYEKFKKIHSLFPTKSVFGGQSLLHGFPSWQDRAHRNKDKYWREKIETFSSILE